MQESTETQGEQDPNHVPPAVGEPVGPATSTSRFGRFFATYRYAKVAIFALVFALIGTLTLLIGHAATTTPTGPISAFGAKWCLDDKYAKFSASNTVWLYTCNGTAAQSWTLASDGTIRLDSNKYCLDTTNASTAAKTPVDLYTCDGRATQQWTVKTSGGSSTTITSTHTGFCLDDQYQGKKNGNVVWAYVCNGTAAQVWAVPKSGTTPPPVVCPAGDTGTYPNCVVSKPPVACPAGDTGTAPNCVAPVPTPTPTPVTGNPTPVGISGSWSLKFDDEFNGTSLNTTNWSTSWFNGGSMNNVKTDPSNVTVSGGDLILTLASSSDGALVSTNPSGGAGKGFQFGNGYTAEARIYFPGSGATIYNWPAWWTDGQNWPTNGETDIAEGLGTLTSNYHASGVTNNGPDGGSGWANGWHTYSFDRENGQNTVYWDGKAVRTYTTSDNGALQYLILNVGSGHTAAYGAASQVKVDYVRVWQKG